ncbi:MAG: porin, partial [Rhodospirillales bacterium]|nr:porin [Rhodospirillales bacterium]
LGIISAAVGAAGAQPVEPVAPGTIQVHLNGYLQFLFGTVGGNGMSGGSYSAGTAWKNSSIGTTGDVRIYPGFDGTTVNGIAYGVQVELRTAASNASGAGVNSSSASSSGVDSLYIRRAYAYIGTGNYGYGRFGQGDGAFELLQTGVIDQFGDDGQWHADGGLVNLLPSGRPGEFIYANQGALYTTDKIVYISPAITNSLFNGALSAAVSYEPNSNGIKQGTASISSAASALNDAVPGGSATRRQNTWDGMIQYIVKGGGFITKISAGYLEGQPLGNTAGLQEYAPLSVWQIGGQTTYKGLFTTSDTVTLGANIKGGAVADGYAFRLRGGRNALAYVVGGAYTTGPWVLGASFFGSQTAAAAGSHGKTLDEYGIAVGGNYILAKQMSLFAQYLYGHKHAYNITPNTNGQAQGFAAGFTATW